MCVASHIISFFHLNRFFNFTFVFFFVRLKKLVHFAGTQSRCCCFNSRNFFAYSRRRFMFFFSFILVLSRAKKKNINHMRDSRRVYMCGKRECEENLWTSLRWLVCMHFGCVFLLEFWVPFVETNGESYAIQLFEGFLVCEACSSTSCAMSLRVLLENFN